jgi:hypothetical protein
MLLLGRVQTTHAQEFAGHVGDTTGAAIPKATVTVTNEDTAVSVKTVTTGSAESLSGFFVELAEIVFSIAW